MKLGFIGFGHRSAGILESFRKAAPDLKVVGIVDRDPENARLRLPEEDRSDVRFFDSLAGMVKSAKPDALAIGTRCDSHATFAIEATPYGLPIFLEKPVAMAENFIAMVRENAPSIAPIWSGLASVYACLAARESAETERFVDVRQVGAVVDAG